MLQCAARIHGYFGVLGSCAAIALCSGYIAKSTAQSSKQGQPQADALADSSSSSPIYGVTIPDGYRDWKLIAVNQIELAGKGEQLRAQLGNDLAIRAFKEGTIPFPDGSIIAAIHWTRVPSEENNKVLNGPFPGTHSFVVGSPVNVQFMVVKDLQRSTRRREDGDSLTSRVESRATRRCTRPALGAICPPRITTSCSRATHLRPEHRKKGLTAAQVTGNVSKGEIHGSLHTKPTFVDTGGVLGSCATFALGSVYLGEVRCAEHQGGPTAARRRR